MLVNQRVSLSGYPKHPLFMFDIPCTAPRSCLKPQSLDIAPLATRPCQLQHEVSGFVWCHVCSREEQGTWACQDGRCCPLFARRYSLQCPCNSRALERNEKEWALSSLWRCLNAQIPIQSFMILDASWLSLTKVFQFIISDAGPEGKFVLDLKNGSGAAKAGEEAGTVSS